MADLPCEPPLDDATLRIGSTGRVYIRPLPGDAADGTIHISTFFTETVAGLLAFHIPSAHGKLRHNTFFTLEQAREEAARRHLECRQVLSRIRSRSSVPLYVSHGTALELHGMIATMNYLPGYGSELVHVSVCRQRDLRKIQG